MQQATTSVDKEKLLDFLGMAVGDLGAAVSAALMMIGDRIGLYKAMAGAGPLTPQELAQKTGTHERYVREWLNNQAAGHYVIYDADRDTYQLPDEHAFALADESSPVYLGGVFDVLYAIWAADEKIVNAFKTGKGVGWHEHNPRLFLGTEKFFRPGYQAHLTTSWIPALDGVDAKLRAGAKVADVGCGHGASTIIMAKTYPNSTFVGYDYHPESIETARQRATEAGFGDRVKFDVAKAQDFPGSGYDLVCFFDCLHDMGDPVGAARRARETLAPDGTVLLVEPMAGDKIEDNLNPIGRMFYGASTFICTANGMSQEPHMALGAQAGEARLRDVFQQAGFSRFRRATETPFNMVLEAKP